jgi:hypothetical protein
MVMLGMRMRSVQLDARPHQLAGLDDPQRRDAALASLRQQAFEADEHDDTAALERLEATLLPALTSRWQTASANERLTTLTIAFYLATPAAEPLWTTAIAQGNPDEVRSRSKGSRALWPGPAAQRCSAVSSSSSPTWTTHA